MVTPGAYPRRKHLKYAPIGLTLAMPPNSKTRLERVTKGKPSSLLGLVIGNEGKSFITFPPEDLSLQNFLHCIYSRELRAEDQGPML
jgi:hypothetical protein